MTDYYSGGSALAGAGIDLGHMVGKWWEVFGIGPESHYVALRASDVFNVSKSGDYALYAKDWVYDAQVGDAGNENWKQAGEADPTGKPATIANVTLKPKVFGKRAQWDENSETVRELMIQGGLALVEEVYTRASLGMMAQAMDVYLKAKLDALTLTGQTQAATAAKWSTASSGLPVSHISAAILSMPIDPDSMIISKKAANYMRTCSEMTTLFGGAVGIGRLNYSQWIEGLQSLGITNVYIGDTTIWGDAAYLFKKGSADPITTPTAIVRGNIQKAGSDAQGVLVKMGDDPNNSDGHWVYAQNTGDFACDTDLIASVTDIY